ncbi:MAG: metal-dependent transcriptional regulator [Gemmatimonadetes bacterium]|nr:metal-dependent transcriptional regulator [Gemmatimonadota bacterium]
MPLSRSVEDYLKAVYSLSEQGEAAGTSELARALDVQPASVTGMIKRLAEEGLLEHEPYRGVRLTEKGEREALQVLRRHRIIETYLVERLAYTWDDVHAEAERLEHTASDTLIERMAEALGNPTRDPHGSPIPTSTGEIDTTLSVPLTEVSPGARLVVRSVADEDSKRLRYFASVGLVPGATGVVESAHASDGTVTLRLDSSDQPLVLGPSAAVRIRVRREEDTSAK